MTLDEIARPIFDEKYGGDWQNFADGFEEGYNYNEKKLSKAKELLTDFYSAIPSSFAEYFKDILERTKEFITKE